MIMQPFSGPVKVLGIPLDENSSFFRGPAQAPEHIRSALSSASTDMCAESGLDLGTDLRWQDIGNIEVSTGEAAFTQIEEAVTGLLAQDARVLSLGGDHSVTYPILRAYAKKYPSLTILHLDAHPDLYDEFEGSRRSHACPFARIMENGLAARLVQVGIRTMNPPQRQQVERFGVTSIEMRDWTPDYPLALEGPLYLSLDIDVLDPAFAPGISHHEPGGLTTREVLRIIHAIHVPLVGADIVEYNPHRDLLGMTAMVAAKFYRELVALLLV